MLNFIIGCAFLALCLYIGGAVLSLVFGFIAVVISLIGSAISWIFGKL